MHQFTGIVRFQILKCLECQFHRQSIPQSLLETPFRCQEVCHHKMAMHKVRSVRLQFQKEIV